jgi:hypothetical protein
MSAKNSQPNFPSYSNPCKENSLNRLFQEQQKITFYSAFLKKTLTGTLLKRLTNSCVVDVSACELLSKRERELVNNKLVISYQVIEIL